ncbi:magnesium chelatase domain-containing protein [Kocuria rhizophila]|nr:magnesium chelatase domain-containing protein [Kocuria rhizophila]
MQKPPRASPRKITVNLSPATLPKRGSHFDVAVATAVLSAQGVARVPRTPSSLRSWAGRLPAPRPGVLPAGPGGRGEGGAALTSWWRMPTGRRPTC